jgi:hypothetical protein
MIEAPPLGPDGSYEVLTGCLGSRPEPFWYNCQPVHRTRLSILVGLLAGASSLALGLPAASAKKVDNCSLNDTSLHWEAVFGHVTSLDQAIVVQKRLARFGYKNIGFERDACDDIEIQTPGVDTPQVRASFAIEANRANIPVTFEAPDVSKSLATGEVNAVFGRFPTLKRANTLLLSMASVGFRENTDIVRLGLHDWKVVMYRIPRSVSASFATEARRSHFSVTFEG